MMEIPTRGRYSVHILQMMATRPYGEVLTKHEIAEAERLSPGYVQQLMMMLKAAGFVNSHRGKRGGFSLARPPERMTVAQVLKACEGPIVPSPCVAVRCEREPRLPHPSALGEGGRRAGRLVQQNDDSRLSGSRG